MVETDFVPDLRPGDDHAHEVLPTCSPYGASMFLLSFLPAQIQSTESKQQNLSPDGPYVPAFLSVFL